MQINLPSLPSLLTLLPSQANVKQWAVGQLLQATVVSQNKDGSVSLQIGEQRVRAQTPAPMPEGTRIQLKVLSLNDKPVLQQVNPPRVENQHVNAQLRQALPKQNIAAPLVANLRQVANQTPEQAGKIPVNVSTLSQKIFSALPEAINLQQPQILKQAIKDSGLFLEPKLAQAALQKPATANAQTQTISQHDFKAGLLKLATLLPKPTDLPATTQLKQHSPPPLKQAAPQVTVPKSPSLTQASPPEFIAAELTRQVDAVLARLNVAQLNSLPVTDSNQQVWLVDIPIREQQNGHNVQLRIQRDNTNNGSENPAENAIWSITLAMHMQSIGPFHARVSLRGEQVSTTLWSEEQHTIALLENNKDLLSARFAQAGLDNQGIHCICGVPGVSATEPASSQLVSEKI